MSLARAPLCPPPHPRIQGLWRHQVKAWRVHANGEPSEVMRLEEVTGPAAGRRGSCCCRVRAANINFPDALLCRGQYQVRPPLPFTPGVEICGEVLPGDGAAGEIGARGGHRRCRTADSPSYAVVDAAAVLPGPRGPGRRRGRRAAHRLPDRLVRTAPPGPPPGGRDAARARRGGRRRQRRRTARQGRRRARSSASSAARTRPASPANWAATSSSTGAPTTSSPP